MLRTIFRLLAGLIGTIIATAILIVGAVIDFVTDIVKWIDESIEELLCEGVTEVHVIKGEPFSQYIKQQQQAGSSISVSLNELRKIEGGVIPVAMNKNGDVSKYQMISSDKGLSKESEKMFNGNNLVTVTIS